MKQNSLKNSGAKVLTREELKKIRGGMSECAANEVMITIYEFNGVVIEYQCVTLDELSGTPGGNNGNPCPQYCEPVGGQIRCVGEKSGTFHNHSGNCNALSPTVASGLHNACFIPATGSFWC